MHLTIFLLAAGAVLAAAQSTSSITLASSTTSSASTATSICADQPVLNQCILTEQARINSCAANDYSCLCQTYGNLLTCYNNCPNDPGLYSVQQEKTQQCDAAQSYGTTTVITAKSTSSSSSMTSMFATSGFASATPSDSASASAASATSTGGAVALTVEGASGLLAVVAAAFGLFL